MLILSTSDSSGSFADLTRVISEMIVEVSVVHFFSFTCSWWVSW